MKQDDSPTFEVVKLRGGAQLPGVHGLTIGTGGLHAYPLLESRVVVEGDGAREEPGLEDPLDVSFEAPSPRPGGEPPRDRAIFGLPEFDALLGGGLTRGTSTILIGNPGTGKTLLALHFALAGVRAGEPTVYVGFRENARQLVAKADAFTIGAEVRAALAPGSGLTLLRWDPVHLNPDLLAERILGAVAAIGARRLVVDSVLELERAIVESDGPGRVPGYMAALISAMRGRGITTLVVRETNRSLAQGVMSSADELSVLAENVLHLEQVQHRAQLHRVLSVLKMRFSAHDQTLREFTIESPEGIRVLAPFESGQGVMADILQQHADHGVPALAPQEQSGDPK